ncbi:protein SPT2 homolog isoform X1 [Pseudophryne corroboree]|uniref:protein SPT2 homolog isoform X1 n=2 Tax=Pseudophryne corroboree TaxID=495146 RepID=UPI003081FBB0
MDFFNVLQVAAAKKSNDGATKRYSLAVGPPKKDPKVKGVQSAAVQAFLRRKDDEIRQKELEEKRRKEELLAKRKELKHDKKARAMASRTKDNFRGYNGIPLEEKPKKRGSSPRQDPNGNSHAENDEYLTEEEMYEFSQTESEHEEEVEEEPPPPPPPKKPKLSNSKKPPPPVMNFAELLRLAEKKQYEPVEIVKPVKKNIERPRTAEEIREIEFLERKNHRGDKASEKQPKMNSHAVKVSKSSADKHSSSKLSRSEDQTSKGSSVSKSNPHHHRDKLQRTEKVTIEKKHSVSNRSEKPVSVSHSKVSKVSSNGNSRPSSGKELGAKQSSSSRIEPTNGKLKQASHSRGSSLGSSSGKPPSGGPGHGPVRPSGGSSTSRPPGSGNSNSVRPSGGSLSAPARPTTSSGPKKSPISSGSVRPSASSGSSSVRPSTAPSSVRPSTAPSSVRPSTAPSSVRPSTAPSSVRPSTAPSSVRPSTAPSSVRPSTAPSSVRPSTASGSVKHPGSSSSTKPTKVGHSTSSSSSARQSSVSGSVRPTSGTPFLSSKPKSIPLAKELGSSMRPPGGPPLGSSRLPAGSAPARPVNHLTPGSGSKPKCTVVSETISSKNFVSKTMNGPVIGMRPGHVNGMRPGQAPSGHRLMPRPPGPPLPPITSSYKRVLDDEEDYDSEMEDFIDDSEEPQDEISKHIREIFGYDKNKYKDESDYALRYMESSFREQQKEEARSLRLGIQEDLEEQRREEEELKRKAKLEKAKKIQKR